MSMTVTSLMTADELLRLPDDGYRYELVQGELRKMSPSGNRHTIIGVRIAASLFTHVKAKRLGEVTGADGGYWITRNPDTVLAPDVGFIRRDRAVITDRFFDGPPDVAIEVISPSDTYTEVEEKTQEWLRAGTRAAPRRNRNPDRRPRRRGRRPRLEHAVLRSLRLDLQHLHPPALHPQTHGPIPVVADPHSGAGIGRVDRVERLRQLLGRADHDALAVVEDDAEWEVGTHLAIIPRPCQATVNGAPSSTRRVPPTPSAARSSPASSRK